MDIKAPEAVRGFLRELVQLFRDQLRRKLVGVYLHGSLAMGCFNPASSDIDILVVVDGSLRAAHKRAIGQRLLQLSDKIPAKGLEMSIVTSQALRVFRHPCPFELHFSNSCKADFAHGTVDFESERTDEDLAAHFVITRVRGICLYGEEIARILPEVRRAYYLDSIVKDCEWSYANIMRGIDEGRCPIPIYGVLNFCRVLAYIEGGLITSKLEGGQWGMRNLPTEYASLVQEALNEYTITGTGRDIDAKLLKQFASYAITEIHRLSEAEPGCAANEKGHPFNE